MNSNAIKYFIIGTFVSLYVIVSLISTIHVVDFFSLSNPNWLAISLAIAFEIGAAASLASLIALKKMNKSLVWGLFIMLTMMQMMGNTYYAFTHLQDFQGWVDLFGLTDEEPIFQKRILSIISGAVLPVVALGFIKSLVDYIKPNEDEDAAPVAQLSDEEILMKAKQLEMKNIWKTVEKVGKLNPPTDEDLEDEPTALANSGIREKAEREAMAKEEALAKTQLSFDFDNPQPMYGEEIKKAVISGITEEKESDILTQQDIKTYQEKSRIPSHRGTSLPIKEDAHPQILPGVNL